MREYYFVLTREEKRVLAFLGAAVLLGLTTKYHHDKHSAETPVVAEPAAVPTASTPARQSGPDSATSPATTPRKRGRPRKSPAPAGATTQAPPSAR